MFAGNKAFPFISRNACVHSLREDRKCNDSNGHQIILHYTLIRSLHSSELDPSHPTLIHVMTLKLGAGEPAYVILLLMNVDQKIIIWVKPHD